MGFTAMHWMWKYTVCERLRVRGETLSLFRLANKRIYSLHQHAEGLRYGPDSHTRTAYAKMVRFTVHIYWRLLMGSYHVESHFFSFFWDKGFWFYEHKTSKLPPFHKAHSLKAVTCKTAFGILSHLCLFGHAVFC